MIDRREFCKLSCELFTGIAAAQYLNTPLLGNQRNTPYIREARYYRQLQDSTIQCGLCPRQCIVSSKQRGYCGVRENQNGEYKTLIYGRLTAINNDPIEKKPLFHFLPGKTALSVSTSGCNVKCKFCQNWNLSQSKPEELTYTYVAPEQLVNMALQHQIPTIAYTYNEPTIFTEYIIDTATIGRERGVRNVNISNGFISREALLDLCKVLDSIKVDFKAFSEDFYRNIVDGSLKPVLDSMVEIKSRGVWLEMVTLIIPTLNDDPAEISEMCKWIMANLGPDVPLHFTRFHPQYLLKNLPPTPISTLETAYKIAKDAGINYVYVGNVPGHKLENTQCPKCHADLIVRKGYFIIQNRIVDGKCPDCSTSIPGVWS